MTAHKHAAMIKAKADNVDLVVFVKNDKWYITKSCDDAMMFFEDRDYFLCLPQHKEACLHALNGGEIEFSYGDSDEWMDSCKNGRVLVWDESLDLMSENYHFRIKPSKVKYWIALKYCRGVSPTLYNSMEEAKKAEPMADDFGEVELNEIFE